MSCRRPSTPTIITIRAPRLAQILAWAEEGKIHPYVSHTFPLSDWKNALRAKWNGDVTGAESLRDAADAELLRRRGELQHEAFSRFAEVALLPGVLHSKVHVPRLPGQVSRLASDR